MKNQKHGSGFHPYEIIFCPTSNCNLKCAHCFVTRGCELNVNDATNFLKKCKSIEKVGFSGGEPFLALDSVCEICRVAVENDLMFDNLMTNGVWWKTEDELESALVRVRDAGFDGKIGLSWDSFHGQPVQKTAMFVNAVHEIFNDKSAVAIWSVIPKDKEKQNRKIAREKIAELAETLGGKIRGKTDRKSGAGEMLISSDELYIPIYRFRESKMPNKCNDSPIDGHTWSEQILWHDKKWFREDYCESTGQVLYVHANGKIAPCCGFANECESLIIGTVKDDYETVMKNASENKMVKICFEEGLAQRRKDMRKNNTGGKMPKGKTNDMCQFCAWVAELCE